MTLNVTEIHYSASGIPGCAGLLHLSAAGAFTLLCLGVQAGQGAVGWRVQKNWSHPLWGTLRATKVWGLSQGSCGTWTKVVNVCWCSWSWKLFFVLRDDGSPGMEGLLGMWTLKTHGLQVGGLIKEFQVWQVQEALQWSGCFVGKYWQNTSVQSHFQYCVLSARWLMENTVCACRTQWWLIATKSL